MSINSYPAGDACGLEDHNDGPGFTDFILGLSLHKGGCATEGVTMNFKEPSAAGGGPAKLKMSQFLPRRSLYVMTGLSKSTYTHGFDFSSHDLVDGHPRPRNGNRMSFTFRSFANVPGHMKAFVGRAASPATRGIPRSTSGRGTLGTSAAAWDDSRGPVDEDIRAAILASLSDTSVVLDDSDADYALSSANGDGSLRRALRGGQGRSRPDKVSGGPMSVVILDASDDDSTGLSFPGVGRRWLRVGGPTTIELHDDGDAGSTSALPLAVRSVAMPVAVVDLSMDPDTTGDILSGKRKREHAASDHGPGQAACSESNVIALD